MCPKIIDLMEKWHIRIYDRVLVTLLAPNSIRLHFCLRSTEIIFFLKINNFLWFFSIFTLQMDFLFNAKLILDISFENLYFWMFEYFWFDFFSQKK